MIKVLIADDHSIVRAGLKKILKEEKDITVCGEASNHGEVISSLKGNKPDVIVLDISMPGRNGLETLKEVKSFYPQIKVLILSMHPEDRYAVRTIKAGADGYVSKEMATDELVNAIRKVSEGQKYISTALAGKLVEFFQNESSKSPHETLSDREFQVFCMIASAKTIEEIAKELSLSPSTVATYRARMMAKMQMRLDTELTSYAIKNKIID